MKNLILPFSSPETNLDLTGGKGINLADLSRSGFPVPPGFIVTTDAYREFVEANQIQPGLLAIARSISPDDLDSLEKSATAIRDLFEAGKIPFEIQTVISRAYQELSADSSNVYVAVRSSATTEDLPGLAFAGQQDTYLNVLGESKVLEAVKRCWSSLWTGRAMAYRGRSGISPEGIALAVIVQEMVPAETAGIVFTANPITGRRDEMVIDASFGLGEAIVSGQVEPDHFVVDALTLKITQRKLGTKEIAIQPESGGGTKRILRQGEQVQALADESVQDLAHMAQKVADHFGSPQDIEWAWADHKLYLLQSRPITSLYPLPENKRPEEGLRFYVNFNSIQGVTDPFTPIGIDAMRLLFGSIRELLHAQSSMDQIMPDAGGRLFIDFTDLVRDERLRAAGLSFLTNTDPEARSILTQLFEERSIPPKRILTPGRILSLVGGLYPFFRRAVSALLWPDRVYPQASTAAELLVAHIQEHARSATTLLEVLQAMEEDLPKTERIGFSIMPSILPVFSFIPLIDRWLTRWLGEPPGAVNRLLRGLSNNVTVEMNMQLWAAAQKIRAEEDSAAWLRTKSVDTLAEAYHKKKLPETAQLAIEGFMKEYGMRGAVEIDLGHAPWRDDPAPILQTLAGYLQIENPDLAPDAVFKSGSEQAKHLAEEYVKRVSKTRFGWLKSKILQWAIYRVRTLSGLRELPLSYMVQVIDFYRTALLNCADELVDRGELEKTEDIFFVPLESLKQVAQGEDLDLTGIVSANRPLYTREQARKQMPRVLLSNGEAFYTSGNNTPACDEGLTGEAVSPGVVEGRVHVILDPGKERLEPGEILVCPSTDPGWTPLFLTASGLVMEIGGLITHGSIVAREYGIPAVVGIHQATQQLKTGQIVRVDGSRGCVTVLSGLVPPTG